jgi:hypothetical protein
MKRRLAAIASVGFMIAAVTAFTIAPAASAAGPTGTATITPSTIPISNAPIAGGGTFTGTISQIQFVNQQGQLALQGLVNGTLSTAAGAIPVVNQLVTLPVTSGAANGTCTILDLTIQPIDLNLLGLMVHTDTIHLTITAQQGPGNLLGNLLCGVANLLNGSGGGGLAHLLNNVLGL